MSALENGHVGPDVDLVSAICDYLVVGVNRRTAIMDAAADGWARGWWMTPCRPRTPAQGGHTGRCATVRCYSSPRTRRAADRGARRARGEFASECLVRAGQISRLS
ncbi:hypothetical protein AB0K25_19960 [Micromonospora sp. NPDC049257]|uniref:hypothetical protein n=1 Tax=Micromonospora sp. NPDC049257 TaxID=3155771 RepID=UPI0034220A95